MQASISLSFLVLALVASSPAAVHGQPGGTCRGQKQLDCPSDVCLNTQPVLQPSVGGSDWVIGLQQCLKGSAISFITWSETDANGDCLPCSATNKVEEVPAGTTFLSLTVPAGSCTGRPICVFVHDGQFQVGKDGSPNSEVAPGCFSSQNQLCAMCAYKITPQVPAGSSCDDGTACTIGDVCAADGTCSGIPTDSVCEDSIACTVNRCTPGDAAADASGCTITYDNSACDDTLACTDDVCVGGRMPELLGVAATDSNDNGCGVIRNDAYCTDRYSACASPTCAGVNGNQLDGCDTSMPEVAQTFCATLNPLQVGSECGSYSCSPGPFMPGSLPGDAGCTFMDDDGSGCDAGADCQTPACTNGACSLIPNDAACAGVFGACVAPKCGPDGCVPGDEIPNACILDPSFECGTSTCNTATGFCDTDGNSGTQCSSGTLVCQCVDFTCQGCCASDADCGACEICDAGKCVPGCGVCEVCDGTSCVVAAEGTECDTGGADCICTGDDTGRDCECLADCPSVAVPGACRSSLAKCAVSSAMNKENNSNCGNACVLLCQTQCGGPAELYSSSDCSSATCSCDGAVSPFNGLPISGNCCMCGACEAPM